MNNISSLSFWNPEPFDVEGISSLISFMIMLNLFSLFPVVTDSEPLRAIRPEIRLIWESDVKYVLAIETSAGMAER